MKNRILTFVAVLIGLSTAILTQSFTPQGVNEWGNDGGDMVDLTSYVRNDTSLDPNTYRCTYSESIICSGTYENGEPDGPGDLEEVSLGIFSLNPPQ